MAQVDVAANWTIEELLGAMGSEDDQAQGAYTVQEIADACGHDVKWVRRKLSMLKQQGRLEVVQVRRNRLDDQPYLTPAYRLKAASQQT